MIYEVRIKGKAERIIASAFDDFEVIAEPGSTLLRGEVIDQAALHGLLDRIQSFGLVLLDVHSIDGP